MKEQERTVKEVAEMWEKFIKCGLDDGKEEK